MTVEKKIYNSWAFSENEDEKSVMNYIIYKELINKYKVYCCNTKYNLEDKIDVNFKDYDVVIGRSAQYLKSRYRIYKNNPKLTQDELALLCDQGNLCFGYSPEGTDGVLVYED